MTARADVPAEARADAPAAVPADVPAGVPADVPAAVSAGAPAEVPAADPAGSPAVASAPEPADGNTAPADGNTAPVLDTTAPVAVADVRAQLAGWLAEAALEPDADLAAPLRDLGVDSLDLIRAARRIEAAFGVRVQLRELFAEDLALDGLVALVADRAARRRTTGGAAPGAAHGPVLLTPSQEQAWEEQTGGRAHWNQALLFTTRPGLDPAVFAEAVRHLVAGHASLRLAFEAPPARRPRQRAEALDPDGPSGGLLDAVLDVVDVRELDGAELAEAITLRCAVEQRSLDPQAGRVARFVRFDAGPARPGRLLIAVHQLAFDMVSWSILLADLERLYADLAAGRPGAGCAEGTSYPEWAQALAAYARTPEAEAEAEWWTEVARTPASVPLDHAPEDPRAANTAATAATHTEEFPPEFTERLTAASRAHRCHPGELLLHALGETLGEVLGGASAGAPGGGAAPDAVRVDVLRHGREETVGDTDLARTTGWFTTTVPVRVDLAAGDPPAARLARTVGHLAALPGGGVGYGALRQHGRPRLAAALRGAAPSDVSFDFEGDDADELPLGGLLMDIADEPVGDITGPDWVRPHLIEVIATTHDDVLRVEWWYSTALHDPATVRRLATHHRATVLALTTTPPTEPTAPPTGSASAASAPAGPGSPDGPPAAPASAGPSAPAGPPAGSASAASSAAAGG
ncbi:condensation domain-containing protein [Streptomyces sp. NPDC090022]|uniref:condensation domain-containing protein n=1 Tax=Streptomyces sp. NPDC090022 TaxID=3365920 RepID=UPI00380690F7